jgi:hypothetical protein
MEKRGNHVKHGTRNPLIHGSAGTSLFCYSQTRVIMDHDEIIRLPTKDIMSEEGAHELATSNDMQPYLHFMMAEMQGHDTAEHVKKVAELPLEKRYVWRVASALKWGFADFDDVTVDIDRQTLNAEDFAKVRELLRFRPIQFCLFLKALLGAEEAKQMMTEALVAANKMG